VSDQEFWRRAAEIAGKATWAYFATTKADQPKIRVVHPAIEGQVVWIATGRSSPKGKQISQNPKVELFYQLGAEMVHLTITGKARFIEDPVEKKRVWEGKVFDYDLAQFWPDGPGSEDFGLLLVEPTRAELTSLPDMMAGKPPSVWRSD